MPQLTAWGHCTLDTIDMKRVERDTIMLTDTRRKLRLSIGRTSVSTKCFVGFAQVCMDKAEKLQALRKVTEGSGFMYTDKLTSTSNTMVKYHYVNTSKEFMNKMNKESAWMSADNWIQRSALSLCLDKLNASWSSISSRTRAGMDQIASTHWSQKMTALDGWSLHLLALTSNELVQCVNAGRLAGKKKYKYESTASRKKQGNELQQPLTLSPFVLKFMYGASAEGYWMYNSMVLQLFLEEGCADVIKTLYPQ